MSEFSEFPEDQGSPAPAANDNVTVDKLFLDSRNNPYKFYISHDEPDFARLTKLIDENGGEVYNYYTEENYAKGEDHLNSIIPITSSLSYVEDLQGTIRYFYKPEFIYDSISEGATLKLDDYRHPEQTTIIPTTINETTQQPESQNVTFDPNQSNNIDENDSVTGRSTAKHQFSPAEDALIIIMARKNPKMVDSKYFFAAVQEKMKNHTIASIRSRFRSKLKNEVKYYYKVNSNGQLLKSNGKNVIDESGSNKGMKAAYTPKDDYFLCELLSQQKLGPRANDSNRIGVLTFTTKNFFQVMAAKHPSHSAQSWRDRYRKFAIRNGILDYKNYYEQATVLGLEPVSLSSFTDFVKKDTSGQYQTFIENRKSKGEEIPEFVPPAEDNAAAATESADEDEDVFMSPTQSPLRENDDANELNNAFNLSNVTQQEFQSEASPGPKKRAALKRPCLNLSPISSPELKAQLTALDERVDTPTVRPPKRRKGNPKHDVLMEGVRITPGNSTKAAAPVFHTPDPEPVQEAAIDLNTIKGVEQGEQDKEEEEEFRVSPQFPEPDHFIPEIAEGDEESQQNYLEAQEELSQSPVEADQTVPYIDPEVLNSMSRSDYLENVSEVTKACKTTEELLNTLEKEMGLSRTFATRAIMAVSGDVTIFTEYIRLYLETKEDPPVGVPGIWTKEYDDILMNHDIKSDEMRKVVKLHSKKRCKYRKNFLEELNVSV